MWPGRGRCHTSENIRGAVQTSLRGQVCIPLAKTVKNDAFTCGQRAGGSQDAKEQMSLRVRPSRSAPSGPRSGSGVEVVRKSSAVQNRSKRHFRWKRQVVRNNGDWIFSAAVYAIPPIQLIVKYRLLRRSLRSGRSSTTILS